MTVLLRHKETKLYFAQGGRWVARTEAALQFRSLPEALLANRQHHLHGTEILLLHSNEQHKVVLPVGQETWANSRWDLPGIPGSLREARNAL